MSDILGLVCTHFLGHYTTKLDCWLASVAGNFLWATGKTMYPGVDSASKNEYQGFLLE